jgi:hypothetical protein
MFLSQCSSLFGITELAFSMRRFLRHRQRIQQAAASIVPPGDAPASEQLLGLPTEKQASSYSGGFSRYRRMEAGCLTGEQYAYGTPDLPSRI